MTMCRHTCTVLCNLRQEFQEAPQDAPFCQSMLTPAPASAEDLHPRCELEPPCLELELNLKPLPLGVMVGKLERCAFDWPVNDPWQKKSVQDLLNLQ